MERADEPGPPDWRFDFTRDSAPGVVDTEALQTAAFAFEVFRAQLAVTSRSALLAEDLIGRAAKEGVSEGAIASILGISVEAIGPLIRGERHLLPELS